MRLLHYALLDLARRPARSFAIALLLTLSLVAMVGTLAYVRAVEHRLAFIEEHSLREVALLHDFRISQPGTSSVEQRAWAAELVPAALRNQPGVVAVGASVGDEVRTHQAPPLNGEEGIGREYDVRFVNPGYAELLPMRLREGRWLEREDWRADGTLQRPLPVVMSTRVRGVAVGDVVTMWRGPTLGAEQLVLQVVGKFARRDNYVLLGVDDNSGLIREGFHDVLTVPPFHIIAPDVVARSAPDHFFVRAEHEGIFAAQRFAWLGALRFAAEARGFDVRGHGRLLPLTETIDLYLAELGPRDRFALWLAPMVLVLTVFGFGSLAVVAAWDRRNEWGVHLALGARQRDVLGLASWELVWLSVVPALVAGSLAWVHAISEQVDEEGIGDVRQLRVERGGEPFFLPDALDYLRLDGGTVLLGLGLIFLVTALVAAAPLLYLRCRSVVELVRSAR